MSSASMSRRIEETPIAAVDLETTGLSPGGDRILEVSVVRIDPGKEPRLILDTLVNPERPVAATEIHGIRDTDVVDAPTFSDVAGELVRGLHGAVLATYNVYFDAAFLKYEFSRIGIDRLPPHVCLMYLRPMLSLGTRCSLNDACRAHGVDHAQAHQAAADAVAAARLWPVYLEAARRAGIATFADLAQLKSYKFVSSWRDDPFAPPLGSDLQARTPPKARESQVRMPRRSASLPASPGSRVMGRENVVHEYWEALKTVLSDLRISPEEEVYLAKTRNDLGLTAQEARAVHARAFADVLRACADDEAISEDEARSIRSLHQCLGRLGWAPGS
jgi:DNA polymerase-3 subunit epsilon